MALKKLVAYDQTLLVADPRWMELKKFGGQGAARRQKRYVVLPFILIPVLTLVRDPVAFEVFISCILRDTLLCLMPYSMKQCSCLCKAEENL